MRKVIAVYSTFFALGFTGSGAVLAFLSGNYLAALWAAVAFLSTVGNVLSDLEIRKLRERNE
ncbi:hypothetical protein ACOJB1_12700 [Enterococcus innesii]|uniref:hypothetical protein n=1 Tax=Enterococcus innesii TaxID=2839759 RepID=UPI003B5B518D